MGNRRAAGAQAPLWLLVTLVALVACTSPSPSPASASRSALGDDTITVGSFNFAESELLAEIYSQALEGGGYRVRRAFRLGPRELVAPALAQGLVEFVPEYAGTALQFLSLGQASATSAIASTHDALVRTLQRRHVTALASAPAVDANAFVVTRQTADDNRLRKLSDLAAIAPRLTFGGPPECASRALCLLGLQRVYGMRFKEFVGLDAGGPVTRQALRDRHVAVALLFTTDPALTTGGFVELADDLGLQPADNVTPLVRTEVVDRWGPSLVRSIDAVSLHLTTDALRSLNAQVADGREVAVVANSWLKAEVVR
jgi:osmoprotectant transport system substrate-binding protein